MNYSLLISCAKGLEYLLEAETKALGLKITRVSPQGVYGEASLTVLYQLCLWSRLANRVQLLLFSGYARNEEAIHQLCLDFHWQTVFSPDKTLAVVFHGASQSIRNSMYGAQIVKDGIVDHCRRLNGNRPSVDRKKPNIVIHAHLKQDTLTLSLDLTGYSLHQRGYRLKAGPAPLKENIAAALLLRARWPELASQGYSLHDPFCGSGTLVIEAAMMAAHIAPGLLRQDQALQYWAEHQPSLWNQLRQTALQAVRAVDLNISGSDSDAKAIAAAKANGERAGVGALVSFRVLKLEDSRPDAAQGLLVCNPPYGERLSELTALLPLYQQLGFVLHEYYQGWQASVLTSNPMLAKAIGLQASKHYALFNGGLACKLYCFSIEAHNQLKDSQALASSPAGMLLNRLKKNQAHLRRWAQKNQISCYRVYDADLPEYAFAIDLYREYALVQEYVAPAKIPLHKTEQRSLELLQVLPQALGIAPDKIVMKQRKPQKGLAQYQKMDERQQSLLVSEGQARFKVNLYDYLDTGLFLDHRPLRLRFAALKPGLRFLNCFCYTATASIHAALAGALTTNVDLSNTYLRWAEENFRLNHIDLSKHQLIQFDCLEWLKRCRDQFDVIFLDPPSFSNSKRMKSTLDVQRDHKGLIEAALSLLAPEGALYFSTHLRSFKLDPELQQCYTVVDISRQTLDLDFKANPKIHQCYQIKS